jgi:hypothetical protein
MKGFDSGHLVEVGQGLTGIFRGSLDFDYRTQFFRFASKTMSNNCCETFSRAGLLVQELAALINSQCPRDTRFGKCDQIFEP